MSLRDAQRVFGFSQEFGLAPGGTASIQSPGPEQSAQPAPAEESRDDGREADKAP